VTNETIIQGFDPAQSGGDRTVKHLRMGGERVELVDWNELSRRGLLERINREILHPLGLAACRDVESGNSPGALVAASGAWLYPERGSCGCGELCEQRGLASDEVSETCRAVHGPRRDA
jgi:hypothetical protein